MLKHITVSHNMVYIIWLALVVKCQVAWLELDKYNTVHDKDEEGEQSILPHII